MHRHLNGLKTALLLGAMSALVLLVGSLFGRTGVVIAFVVALAMNGYAYFNSDKIAQRGLGIDPEMPRDIRHDEEKIAELLGDFLRRRRTLLAVSALLIGNSGFELGDFLIDLGEHGCERRPVEANARSARLELHARG